jgi:hypothetical protein
MFGLTAGQIGAEVAAEERRRHVRRAGRVGVGHRRVAVLLELDRARPPVLDRVAQPVQRADARVAAPREDEALHEAGPDQLVVEQIRRHPDQRQLADPLADDLVAGRKRDQMREPLHGDAVARAHQPAHGVVQGEEIAHRQRSITAQCVGLSIDLQPSSP